MSAFTASANIIDNLMFMSGNNGLYMSDISDIDETAETGVSDHRRRRKTAELHTSGAIRAEAWGGGGKEARAGHRLGGGVGE